MHGAPKSNHLQAASRLQPQAADWDAGSGDPSRQSGIFGTTGDARLLNGIDRVIVQSDHESVLGPGDPNGTDSEPRNARPGHHDVHRDACHRHQGDLKSAENDHRGDLLGVHRGAIPADPFGRRGEG